jgi:hypothetical protein
MGDKMKRDIHSIKLELHKMLLESKDDEIDSLKQEIDELRRDIITKIRILECATKSEGGCPIRKIIYGP